MGKRAFGFTVVQYIRKHFLLILLTAEIFGYSVVLPT